MHRGLLIVMALVAGCATQRSTTPGEASPFSSGRGQTLVNLHPDNEHSRLYAANFQQAGLIPVCSDVEYLKFGRKALKFRVVSTGRDYEYMYHKAAAEPLREHLARFFGPTCPREVIESLPQLDQQGIREGRALVGMTRQGVILAMGHPPRRANPDPNASSFLYWKSRFNRVEIQFDANGLVSAIRD